MERQEQIDFGERLLVAGVMTVLVVEAIFTVLSATLWYNPYRLLLSVVGGVLILMLGGWLYSGDRRAWRVAVGWTGLEVVLTLIPLVLLLGLPNSEQASVLNLEQALGVPAPWLTTIKLLVYLGFVLLLLVSVNVHAFLDSRHAHAHPHPGTEPIEEKKKLATPVALTEQQSSLFQSLAGTFQGVGLLALVAGAGMMVYEITTAPLQSGPEPLVLLEGLVLLILGLVLMLPPGSLNLAAQAEGETADLDQVFRRLGWLGLGILLGALVFLGVAVAWLRPLYSS